MLFFAMIIQDTPAGTLLDALHTETGLDEEAIGPSLRMIRIATKEELNEYINEQQSKMPPGSVLLFGKITDAYSIVAKQIELIPILDGGKRSKKRLEDHEYSLPTAHNSEGDSEPS